MNFNKLQLIQAELDTAILQAKPQMTAEERINKTLVALSVAIARVHDCEDKGKVDEKRFIESGSILTGEKDSLLYDSYFDEYFTRNKAHRLTLVEECADALRFILSLANQVGTEIKDVDFTEKNDMSLSYLELQGLISGMRHLLDLEHDLPVLFEYFFSYIDGLGITTEELEQAYYNKNKINYERLESGY